MFEKSQMYKRLEKIRHETTLLMRERLVTEITAYLYEMYRRKNSDSDVSFLRWLSEQSRYSEVVGGRMASVAAYVLFEEVDKVFDTRDAFRDALEDELNSRFGEENASKLIVRIADADLDQAEAPNLIAFDYDETWAWGD